MQETLDQCGGPVKEIGGEVGGPGEARVQRFNHNQRDRVKRTHFRKKVSLPGEPGGLTLGTACWAAWGLATPGDFFANGSLLVYPTLLVAGGLGAWIGFRIGSAWVRGLTGGLLLAAGSFLPVSPGVIGRRPRCTWNPGFPDAPGPGRDVERRALPAAVSETHPAGLDPLPDHSLPPNLVLLLRFFALNRRSTIHQVHRTFQVAWARLHGQNAHSSRNNSNSIGENLLAFRTTDQELPIVAGFWSAPRFG